MIASQSTLDHPAGLPNTSRESRAGRVDLIDGPTGTAGLAKRTPGSTAARHMAGLPAATAVVAGDTCDCGHAFVHHGPPRDSLPGRRWCPQCQQLCHV